MKFFCDWREFATALWLAQCKEEAKRQDVAVPTGWQDGYEYGPSIQPSRGPFRGRRGVGDIVCGVGSGPIVRDVESPQQPRRGSYAIVVDCGLA